ncbi:MAG: bifunctional NAD(P)H-hydrate repair enzyme [Ignavibacteriaceae bacterium]|nr:MAG: bifunctional NAD(P)H-hydrate repair enzyme [Ignavibacteriaceae bacterium]
MELIYTAEEARYADIEAIEGLGFDSLILMENAGRSIAAVLEALEPEHRSVAIICGKGNNGGDGFAAARHLRDRNWQVTVVFVGEPEEFSEDSKYFFDILARIPKNIAIFQYKDPDQLRELTGSSLVIIDALVGTGTKGELRYPYDEIVITLNEERGVKIAVDIPSGLDPDTGMGGIVFNAHQTVALCTYKRGFFYGKGIDNKGQLEYGYIGVKDTDLDLESNWFLYEISDVRGIIPYKKKTINKYSAGGPVIVAGSNRYPGAATLAYQGAFFSGSGSPVLLTSEKAASVLLNQTPEAVVIEYPVNFNSEAQKQMLDALAKKDVLLIGPGLGRSPETTIALEKVYQISNKLVILDADALAPLYNGNFRNFDLRGKILLPHTGEFASLLGMPLEEVERNIFSAVEQFVEETGAILVLKHAAVFISSPAGFNYVCDSGTEELAKFGTGDGLAGVIASTLAQILSLPLVESIDVIESLIDLNTETHQIFAGRIADAVHTFNIAAHLLGKDAPGTPITSSSIVRNIPAAIKKISEINESSH